MRSRTNQSLRLIGAFWLFGTLIWLPFEDTAVWMAVVLAIGAYVWLWLRFFAAPAVQLWRNLIRGALLGSGMPLFAIFLMAVKSGLHGHGFADFTARQIVEVLTLLPITIIVGVAIGWLSATAQTNP